MSLVGRVLPHFVNFDSDRTKCKYGMSCLFVEDQRLSDVAPSSLEAAKLAASKILRSDVYKNAIVNIFGKDQPHMDKEKLDVLLVQNEIFTIDRTRTMESLNARACTMRQFDCWRIYLNPLLLLEMKDRELELKELQDNPNWIHTKDMIGILGPFHEDGSIAKRDKFNSLLRIHQLEQVTESPSNKKPKLEEPNILENNKLLLTILLVHECSHLLNYLFSNLIDRSTSKLQITPSKAYPRNYDERGSFGKLFKDFGHMVEKEIFGFVIHHVINPHFQTPFGIHRIIGCENERTKDGHVLVLNSKFQALLDDREEVEINCETLLLTPTVQFLGEQVQCIVVGASTGGLIEDIGMSGESSQGDSDEEDVIKQYSIHVRQ
jgi:hypothetical protein